MKKYGSPEFCYLLYNIVIIDLAIENIAVLILTCLDDVRHVHNSIVKEAIIKIELN